MENHNTVDTNRDKSDLLGRVRVQTAYPPPVQRLVVSSLCWGLGLEGGAVAGLQSGLLIRRQVLGLSPYHSGWLYVCVSLVLSPACRGQRVRGFPINYYID